MKRRKRMGMPGAPVNASRVTIDGATAPHPVDVVEMPRDLAKDPGQSQLESTPEKFVAFVNRMAEAEARSTSRPGETAR